MALEELGSRLGWLGSQGGDEDDREQAHRLLEQEVSYKEDAAVTRTYRNNFCAERREGDLYVEELEGDLVVAADFENRSVVAGEFDLEEGDVQLYTDEEGRSGEMMPFPQDSSP